MEAIFSRERFSVFLVIAIVDYGMGNLRSVQKGFEKAGWEAQIVSDDLSLSKSSGIVLPGVGAFARAVENLKRTGLFEAIISEISAGKPFLGICLGLQLLFEVSEEWGLTDGMGILPGRVKKLPDSIKVPHMGWNQVFFKKESPLMEGITDGSYFYFVHSFYVEAKIPDQIAGITEYGLNFASMVQRDSVFGIQFHPEKSSALGLRILKNFGRLVADNDRNPRG
ncbi:MAG: Imidazole glycerol phosphate synthase subunit HisH [Desulfotomaculum sp. 46_296]|nr:MAG: Imidazole glycerol phosphate synthase subunit HisH [Desulfotomaculum sp. 46_296]